MKSAILRSSLGLTLAIFVLSPASGSAAEQKPENNGWVSLFNGKDFNGWYTYLDSAARTRTRKASSKFRTA